MKTYYIEDLPIPFILLSTFMFGLPYGLLSLLVSKLLRVNLKHNLLYFLAFLPLSYGVTYYLFATLLVTSLGNISGPIFSCVYHFSILIFSFILALVLKLVNKDNVAKLLASESIAVTVILLLLQVSGQLLYK